MAGSGRKAMRYSVARNMGLHFFHSGSKSNPGGSTQHLVGENPADWLASQNGEGFRAGTRGENQVAFSLENSLAQAEVGFVVLYAQDGWSAGLSTRKTLASPLIRHGNSKDTQTGEL